MILIFLLIEDFAINTQMLTIPHPRLLERAFVLIPLQEIAPKISIHKMSIKEVLAKINYRMEDNKIYQ